ncbi:integral membrane protein GPR137C-like isoform X2 [Pelobates fuscus]|uniref:integral membrane protein GPR137C-like isoform X2 n=1 Tax=Pelobates fuscus TaxID=191477 RepID=UPI002FE4C35B
MSVSSMQGPIPWEWELGLTVLCTGLSACIFVATYLQLWLLRFYNQRRLSMQSLGLFLCLFWGAIRTVLYSYYLSQSAQGGPLKPFPHWLPYCSADCLQFLSLALLNIYLSKVIFKASLAPGFNECKCPVRSGIFFVSLVFLITNLSLTLAAAGTGSLQNWIPKARMIISDVLYTGCSISLATYICNIYGVAPVAVYLESKGTSGSWAVFMCLVTCTMYTVRALYNLVTVFLKPEDEQSPLSYGWNGVSDNVATEEIDSVEYVIFGIIFITCEILPMSTMVYFFRAKNLNPNLEEGGMVNSQSFGSRTYFFDNPRRYDSDDDLPKLAEKKGGRASLSSVSKYRSPHEGICPSGSCAISPPLQKDSTGSPVHFTCGGHTMA